MATISEALAIALGHHQAGRLDAAQQIYQRILQVEPEQPDALHFLGVLTAQLGRPAAAAAYIARATAVNPDMAPYHLNLGLVYQELQKPDEAIACYRRAVELRPEFVEAHYNLGGALAWQGQLAEAAACYRRALELKPDFAEAHYNLGKVLQDQGQLDEAAACYRQAIQRKPDYAEAHYNLGTAFKDQGKLDEAVACYRRAVQLKPDYAAAHGNMATALQDLGQLDEAVACCRRTLELQPDSAEAHYNLGNVFKDQGKLDEAVACYRRAVELNPDYAAAQSNIVYALYFRPGYDAPAIYEEHRRWNQRFAEPLAKFIEPHANERSTKRRLRIGYVSPDFREHVVGRNLLPLFREHDREQFEILCYAQVLRPDAVTSRFQGYAGVWRNVVGLADEAMAQRIREDRVDILVDLTLHMAQNRLLVFARKPAPVQVTFAGYPGTTGLSAIDYRLTDPHLDPPDVNDQCYAEESIRLADTFWCYDPQGSEPPVNPLPTLEQGRITFGCLNNFCKINAAVLKLWAQVLKAVARSQIMILAAEGSHRQHTLDLLEQEGIAPDRVIFVVRQSGRKYLELYHRIDVGLDTFPYNGHTTSLDSFWMGVPVVTLAGATVVGRAGVSQLRNLGLKELIADGPEQFVRIAVELAGDLSRLGTFRATLRELMRRSPLMDAPRFTRSVEAAYRMMWQRWCLGADRRPKAETGPIRLRETDREAQ